MRKSSDYSSDYNWSSDDHQLIINGLFQSSDEQLLADFKAELRKCILWTLKEEPKSPFTKHVIEFMAKFLRIFSVHEESTKDEMNTSGDTTIIDEDVAAEVANDCSDQENRQPVSENDESFDELGMESLGSDSFSRSKRQSTGSNLNTSANSTVRSEVLPQSTFSDIIIKEQLIPFLRNVKPQIRLNCCILLRKLLVDIEDVDLNVYNKLKKVSFVIYPSPAPITTVVIGAGLN